MDDKPPTLREIHKTGLKELYSGENFLVLFRLLAGIVTATTRRINVQQG